MSSAYDALCALEPAGGTELWRFNVMGPAVTPAVGSLGIYAASHDLVALDPTDGSELWVFTAGGDLDTPAPNRRLFCLRLELSAVRYQLSAWGSSFPETHLLGESAMRGQRGIVTLPKPNRSKLIAES